jgi:leader peptidase (prepilin peptidase)/N-methyltransferase
MAAVPVFQTQNPAPLVMQAVFFIALLIAASAFDIRKRIIPDGICALIAPVGLIMFSPVKIFGISAALPLLIPAIYKPGCIGGGDIKLTAACGIVLGFEGGIAGLAGGLAAMLLFYAGSVAIDRLRKSNRKRNEAALPMAPFLSIGFIAAYLLNFTGH